MMNPKPNYLLRYFFDWRAGCCLWSANDAARTRFDYGIVPEKLPLPESLRQRMNELMEWHDKALNWEYPPDPGPWRQEECERFNQAAKDLLTAIRRELGHHFEVIDEFTEMKEDLPRQPE